MSLQQYFGELSVLLVREHSLLDVVVGNFLHAQILRMYTDRTSDKVDLMMSMDVKPIGNYPLITNLF